MDDKTIFNMNIYTRYLDLWRKLTGWKLFLFFILHYTVLFFVLHQFVFASFSGLYGEDRSFMWYAVGHDGVSQHFARLLYISRLWRKNISALLSGQGWTFPLYDFAQGPAFVDTQMGLPQFLAVFWPDSQMESFYTLLVLSIYYGTGLSFSAFGLYWKQRPLPVLIGAVSYTFSGFALYAGVRHPHFVVPMILLPLLLTGAEQILRKGRSWLFSVTVFLSLTTQWGIYFSYMQFFFVFLYVSVRFFDIYSTDRFQQARLLVIRLLVWGGMPILLSAVSWMPALLNILESGRVGNSVDISLCYEGYYYTNFLESFIVNPFAAWDWTFMGFSVLTLPAVLLLFFRRKREERALRILFLVLTVMLGIPAIGYAMSGFSNVSNRFCFGYAFCTASVLMFMVPHLVCITRKTLGLIFAGAVTFSYLCSFFDRDYFDPSPISMLFVSVLILGLCYKIKVRQNIVQFIVLFVTCFSVCYSAYLLYDPTQIGYVFEFVESGKEAIEMGQYAALAKSETVSRDDGFYRVSGSNIRKDELNFASYYGLNGISMYPYYGWSTAFVQWLRELEVACKGNKHMIFDLDNREPLMTLANVKYFADRKNGKSVIPYGFEKADSVEYGHITDSILYNPGWLPVGYTYDHYMLKDTYNKLNALDKQEAELSAVILEKPPVLPGLQEAEPERTAIRIPYEVIESDALVWEDGILKIEDSNAVLTLSFEGLPQTDTYLRIVELHMNEEVSVTTEQGTATGIFYTDDELYDNGQNTQTLYLGYSEDGFTTATINFYIQDMVQNITRSILQNSGRLDDIQIWCQPRDHYNEQITALGREALKNVTTDWRSLRGEITIDSDKLLCLAIPYSDGWTAYVDGQKTTLYQANTAFMAVELSPGVHTVELRYWMPGLTPGLVMGGAGMCGLFALLFIRKKNRKQ